MSGFRRGVVTSSLFRDVTKRSFVSVDISGQLIGSILKRGPIGCAETSVNTKLRRVTSQKIAKTS